MNVALNVFIFYLLHVALTAGLFCLFGVVIAACNKLFYASLGGKSQIVCYATGFIGTPIHELSHALMCLVFGHKITEIKLFQINSADGVLGYVNHSYNPRNIYQRMGNFFIGIAPVLVGFLILTGLFYLLLPDVFAACVDGVASVNWSGGIGGFFDVLKDLFGLLFGCFGMWQWWVFVVIGSFIALHMTLSRADWKGATTGIVFFLVIFAVIDIIVAVVSMDAMNAMTAGILSFSVFVLYFGVIFIVLILLLALLSTVIGKLIFRRLV